MNALTRILAPVVAIELVGAAVLFGLRLNATRVSPPSVEQNHDAITGRALLDLPDRFLFDGAEKWRMLGDAYLVTGYFAKAEACLRRALEADPQSFGNAYSLGLCLERLGRIDEAGATFRRPADWARRDLAAICWHHVGLNHLRNEQADEAAHAFETAGEEFLPSVYERAKLLIRAGRPAQATPLLERLAAAHPESLHILFYRARAAAALGHKDDALRLYDALDRGVPALALDDTEDFHRRIREGFGMAREVARANAAGTPTEAANRLGRLVADGTRWENSYLFLLVDAARAHVDARRLSDARPLLEQQINSQQFPTGRVWELLGDVEQAAGKPSEAWDAWSRAARMHTNPRLHFKLAQAARERGEQTLSKQHLALAELRRGIEQFRAGEFQESRETLRLATDIDPQNPDLWYYLGECERLLGCPTEATAAYRGCLKRKPHHGRALARLGE